MTRTINVNANQKVEMYFVADKYRYNAHMSEWRQMSEIEITINVSSNLTHIQWSLKIIDKINILFLRIQTIHKNIHIV